MDLRTLLPSLSGNVHRALEEASITTAHDILFTPLSQIHSRLDPSVLSLLELTDLKEQVIQLVSSPARRGDDLFTREEERKNTCELCPCGVDELDALLGGFGTHCVIEIAGGTRSGKSVTSASLHANQTHSLGRVLRCRSCFVILHTILTTTCFGSTPVANSRWNAPSTFYT